MQTTHIRVRQETKDALSATAAKERHSCSIPELLARIERGDEDALDDYLEIARRMREALK